MSETLGRYRIEKILSRGGSATTYKAYQPQLDRPVLLKVLHPSLTKDEKSVERFSREAKAVARIRHEGIVHIYDYGKADGLYYIAMEYVKGLSLAELLLKRKRVPVDVSTYVIIQSARSLGYAHSQGIVHRDVKPGNIILGYDGGVKVTDFGLAYSEDLSSITVNGELFGTPSYMSPEQIKGEKVDARTDIYSLGLTFYQMLSGVQPFSGSNYSAIITKKLTEDLPPLKRVVPDCPQQVLAAIGKMVERNAGRRYSSTEDLVQDLTGFAEESKITLNESLLADYLRGEEESEPLSVSPAEPRRRRRHSAYVAAVVVLFLALGFSILKMTDRRSLPQAPVGGEPDTALVAAGSVYVSSNPRGASVLVDGIDRMLKTPTWIAGLEPGEHELSVVLEGYRSDSKRFTVGEKDTARAIFSLHPLTGTGFLKVSANPWAAVYVNGDSIDTTPFSKLLRLESGNYEIVLCNPDFPDYVSNIEIAAGETTDVSVDLASIWSQPTPSRSPGYARILVEPWASVFVDGDSVDTTPFNRLLRLQQGSHRLVLSNPNFPDYAMNLDVVQGETTRVFVDLKNEFGYLMVSVDPWADVYVDGEYRDTTPLTRPIPVLPGEHLVKLVGPSSSGWEKRLSFQRGTTIVENVVLSGG